MLALFGQCGFGVGIDALAAVVEEIGTKASGGMMAAFLFAAGIGVTCV
jgi:hypothetical protein